MTPFCAWNKLFNLSSLTHLHFLPHIASFRPLNEFKTNTQQLPPHPHLLPYHLQEEARTTTRMTMVVMAQKRGERKTATKMAVQ
jgi:hypothetical protein